MTWINLIALLCAASAWLVWRHAPQHRPVAIALTICAGLDVVRSVMPLPPRVDLALCLGAPAVSAWCYTRSFGALLPWFPAVAAYASGIAWAWIHWEWGLPVAYTIGIGLSVFAISWRKMGPWTVTQRTAAMLLAGDVAGLLLLVRRDWVHYQAGVVLALVTGYQVWWIWRRPECKSKIGTNS